MGLIVDMLHQHLALSLFSGETTKWKSYLKQLSTRFKLDYISTRPYRELDKVLRAANFDEPSNFSWKSFWTELSQELTTVKTKIVILNRIGPYAPHTHHIALPLRNPFHNQIS